MSYQWITNQLLSLFGMIGTPIALFRIGVITIFQSLFGSSRLPFDQMPGRGNGGFFDHIRRIAPQLSTDTTLLEEEHLELMRQVLDLTTTAETCEGSTPWWQSLKEDFHKFSKELMHHESQENQLLQRAYSEDIGSHD